jgi:hypothetical protein
MLILAGAQISEHLEANWVLTEGKKTAKYKHAMLGFLAGRQAPNTSGIDPDMPLMVRIGSQG